MTATELVQSEIRRFLKSTDPEVLCVTGEWGVGKTFTWQRMLREARTKKSCALARYSYASLFGINSLEGLKVALFENLEFLDSPPETSFEEGIHGAKSLAALAKKLGGVASAIPYVGTALSKAGPLFFSLVRNQIICIDDLERRGNGLDVRDVFGLISFLREQRGCKVMLLLNAESLHDGKKDFDTYFEKVIDTCLVFAPTAAEAVAIALPTDGELTELLRINCKALAISNIRVIKKIERLAKQIDPLLAEFAPEVANSAIRSLTLFGWSKFQPNLAPPLDYLRVGPTERHLEQIDGKIQKSPEEQKWDTLLASYEFVYLDDLDREILKFVDDGVLDSAAIKARASELNQQVALHKQSGSFSAAWNPFHDSFDDNFDQVSSSLIEGVRHNFQVVSLSNFNAIVKVLKEMGCHQHAKELIEFYIANKGGSVDFWKSLDDPFQRGPFDPDVAVALSENQAKNIESFVTDVEMLRAAETYNADAIKRLAEVPTEEYYQLIKAKRGDEMRKFILSALNFRRIANATPEMNEVIRRMEEALQRIGAESRLNAVRVLKFGVSLDDGNVHRDA
jgi:hypothetical protein